jgi:MerR family transcriptional regulator/heat shock protein HspR
MANFSRDEPVFQISVVARMIGVHQQTLRTYERMGFVIPARSSGNQRLYSQHDVELLQRLRQYVEDLGVNLAGAEVLLRLNRRVEHLQDELDETRAELALLRSMLPEHTRTDGEPE